MPDLVIMTMIRNDVHRLDNVAMLEGGANAKLGGDLFLILSLGFGRALRSEFLDSEDGPTRLRAALDETDGASRSGPEHATPLAVLLG
jgi:hypothetical protein